MGLALHAFHDVYNEFPPARSFSGTNISSPLPCPTGVFAEGLMGRANDIFLGGIPQSDYSWASWMFRILPYIEQGNLYNLMISANAANLGTTFNQVAATPIPIYICPSDGRLAGTGSYTSNTGSNGNNIPLALQTYCGVTGSDERTEATTCGSHLGSNATNGVFAVMSWSAQPGKRRGVQILGITDGSSNTVMVGERPPSSDLVYGAWIYPDYETTLAVPNFETAYAPGCPVPADFKPEKPTNACAATHYWSMHMVGGNWLLGDGSVRFLTYNAAITVVRPMASRNGGEIVTPEG
jgi:hypothetical protein